MFKRKKTLAGLLTFLILAIIALFARGVTLYKAAEIPFVYDPNQVNHKLLGGIQGRAGTDFVYDVNCYDPDGDPFTVVIMNPSPGMIIAENLNSGKWDLMWNPSTPGVYYVDLEVTDSPPPGNQPLSDQGTIVFNVLVGNRPPVLKPR